MRLYSQHTARFYRQAFNFDSRKRLTVRQGEAASLKLIDNL